MEIAFQGAVRRGDLQVGIFQKTPAVEIVELLALSGANFVCFDAEHAAFGRRDLDSCLAIANALNLPALVRVAAARPECILQALDGGASGILVPHIASAALARQVVAWARFGRSGGRGYSGSTRAAGYGRRPMGEVLQSPGSQPLIFAQIEEPPGLAEIDDILSLQDIAGVFFGAADYAVASGCASTGDAVVKDAMKSVLRSGAAHGKPVAAFAADTKGAVALRDQGVRLIIVGSEQSLIASGMALTVSGVHDAARTPPAQA